MFIVVGVTGGIAAYKAVQVVRLLVKAGHDVHVVPTANALRFVGLPTWQALSRNPVTASVYDDVEQVRHVALGRSADLVIVAPATAASLAKMAAGIADDLLGTTLLATSAPVVVAPAMHTEMWRHPATVANIALLRARGVRVVGPAVGELTGGDSGPGRMLEPDDIVAQSLAVLRPRDMAGLRVAVSAGGTREPIDPVRHIGNRSSGRQGVALARAAADRGAQVTLVAAHTDDGVLADVTATAGPALGGTTLGGPAPGSSAPGVLAASAGAGAPTDATGATGPADTAEASTAADAVDVAASARNAGIQLVRVGTAAQLGTAMTAAAATADVVVMAAAVADYRPAAVSDAKLTKESAGGAGRTIELVETADVLAGLAAARRPGQTIVGFAAETVPSRDELLARGRHKLARKGCDLLVVNAVGWNAGFEASDNTVVILRAGGDVVAEASGSKRAVADAVWDAVVAARV